MCFQFQKECGRLGRRYKWLSCCLWLAPNLPPGPAPATGSSSAPGSVPQQAAVSAASAKHTRQQRHHSDDQGLEDVSDRDHPTVSILYLYNNISFSVIILFEHMTFNLCR